MADAASEKTQETAVADPAALASQQSPDEPRRVERDIEKTQPVDDESVDAADDRGTGTSHSKEEGGNERSELNRLQSYATATSVTSARTGPQLVAKPWYKQPNPLRWGKIPPAPKEREVSGEYKAGFFSSLVFHWMSPLMRVSLMPSEMREGRAG